MGGIVSELLAGESHEPQAPPRRWQGVLAMKLIPLVSALMLIAPAALAAQQSSGSASAQPAMPPGFEIPKDMTSYFIAIAMRGPKFMTPENAGHTELTRQHLKYIRRMIEEKKYMFAGPFLDGGEWQGMAVVAA